MRQLDINFRGQDFTIRIAAMSKCVLTNGRIIIKAWKTQLMRSSIKVLRSMQLPLHAYFIPIPPIENTIVRHLNLKYLQSNSFNALRQPTPYIVLAVFEHVLFPAFSKRTEHRMSTFRLRKPLIFKSCSHGCHELPRK